MYLHFTGFEKIPLAWVKVKLASHMTLWLAWSFCILCTSLIFSLKTPSHSISSHWHIWALSLSHASTDSSFHWRRIKEEGPTPVTLLTEAACCLRIHLHPVPCFLSSKRPVRLLCCKEKEIVLPALRGCRRRATPSTLISYCCLKCQGCCDSLDGLQWREGIVLLSFCFVCAAPGIGVLTRPGHVSTAIVQTISSANCMLSGSRGTLQSRLAGQRKASLCDVSRNNEPMLGAINTAFCGGGSFLLTWCGLLELVSCGPGGAGLFQSAHSLRCVLCPKLMLSLPWVRVSANRVCACCRSSIESWVAARGCWSLDARRSSYGTRLLQPCVTSAQTSSRVVAGCRSLPAVTSHRSCQGCTPDLAHLGIATNVITWTSNHVEVFRGTCPEGQVSKGGNLLSLQKK